MKCVIVILAALLMVGYGGYWYGKNKAQTKILYKQAEDVKNVARKRAKIQAAPNARRDELLELMRAGRL